MADRRTVDELTIEELERILLIKRRQARQERLRRLAAEGRLADRSRLVSEDTSPPPRAPKSPQPAHGGFRSTNMHPLADTATNKTHNPAPVRGKTSRVRDRLLLGMEILALAGLVAVLLSSYADLRLLNQEVAIAREPTQAAIPPTPTPLVHFDRLPGGHSPPTSPGGAVPDVPAHLQQWVQPAPAQPVPTPSAALPTRIVIPSIGTDAPIVDGVTWDDLKKGVGHLPGSGNPGERGNLYLAAHNDIFGEIFRYLDKLELGDEFFVYSGEQSYRYVITSKRVIEPTDVSVMYPTTEPIATLQTCYPYLVDTHRLVVVGELAE